MSHDDKDDDDFDTVSKMADRLKLKKGSRDRARYVDEHMRGLGYRMVPSYVREEEDGDDDDGSRGRFRVRRSGRSRRDDDDDDW